MKLFNRWVGGLSLLLSAGMSFAATTSPFSPYVDVGLNSITQWDGASGSMQPIGLLDVVKATGLKQIRLAFITAQGTCTPTWAANPVTNAENGFAIPVLKQLKQSNVAYTIALGGLSGTYLAQSCKTKQDLVDVYEFIVKTYQPAGLDFDIENTLQSDDAKLDRMMQVIKIIKSHHPKLKISFTLPVLPTGLVENTGLNVIRAAVRNHFTDYAVNIMAMDYGPSFQDKSMAEYAIDAARNTLSQVKALESNGNSDASYWRRIQITPMIGLNDTIPLNFSLDDVDQLKQFSDNHGVGLLSFWSITRDHSCSNKYVDITCSSLNPKTGLPNQQVDYQYTARFLK